MAGCTFHTGTGVIFDLFTLGALIAASVQFQTDSGAFMSAVKEIAGTSGGNTGLNVVDKAAQARSTLKVLGALSSISKLLQVRAASGSKMNYFVAACHGIALPSNWLSHVGMRTKLQWLVRQHRPALSNPAVRHPLVCLRKPAHHLSSMHLQESGAKAGQAGEGTLSSLSTYLLLQKAEEQYGWTPDKEGISNDEAGTIARLFAQYDTNSDDK